METTFKYVDESRFNNFADDAPTNGNGGGFDFGALLQNLIPGAASGIITAATNKLGAVKTGMAADVKAVCGRKPLLNLGGKKDAYNACAQKYAADVNAANLAALNQANAPVAKAGLSTGAWIAISATGLLLVGGIVFLVVKNK